jgi:hypothetical protein
LIERVVDIEKTSNQPFGRGPYCPGCEGGKQRAHIDQSSDERLDGSILAMSLFTAAKN